MSMTSETSFRLCRSAARRAACRSPSSPSPWKLYGELRGLNAPPRRTFAPAALDRRGASPRPAPRSRPSTGPAMTIDLVAADPHVADGDDGVLRLERAAGELVGLGDPQHFLHAVEHLEQPRVELPLPADRAEHRAQRAGRPVHVEAHLDELRDDALDLLVGRPLLHDYNHDVLPLQFYRIVRVCPRRRRCARAAALRR